MTRIVQHEIEITESAPFEALEVAERKDGRDPWRKLAARISKMVTSFSELDHPARRRNVRYQLPEALGARVRLGVLSHQAA